MPKRYKIEQFFFPFFIFTSEISSQTILIFLHLKFILLRPRDYNHASAFFKTQYIRQSHPSILSPHAHSSPVGAIISFSYIVAQFTSVIQQHLFTTLFRGMNLNIQGLKMRMTKVSCNSPLY